MIIFSTGKKEKKRSEVCRDLLSKEWALGDVSVLASQITNLAGGGIRRIAGWHLATDVRVQMGFGSSAVAVSRHWLVVNVIY